MIPVDRIKDIDERFCYAGRGGIIVDHVQCFLKNNDENAYSIKEIMENINKLIPDPARKFNASQIAGAVKRMHAMTDSPIKKKGNHWWYEKHIRTKR